MRKSYRAASGQVNAEYARFDGKMPGKSRADSPKRVPFEGQEASWTLNGSHL